MGDGPSRGRTCQALVGEATGDGRMRRAYFLSKQGRHLPILTVLIVLIVVGVLLWLVNSFIPMDHKIKTILNVVVVIVVIIWLLQAFGLLHSLQGIKVG